MEQELEYIQALELAHDDQDSEAQGIFLVSAHVKRVLLVQGGQLGLDDKHVAEDDTVYIHI